MIKRSHATICILVLNIAMIPLNRTMMNKPKTTVPTRGDPVRFFEYSINTKTKLRYEKLILPVPL